MTINFHKYHGTGNDFIILDNRAMKYDFLTKDQIKKLCDRYFGIGADGLMLLNEKEGFDFEMKYFNADGLEGSMCGNGSRCIIKFAHSAGIHRDFYKFLAYDGPHEGEMNDEGMIAVKMQDVTQIKKIHTDFILDTGSLHYVKMVMDVMNTDVLKKGREIRYSKEFEKNGINVNFVEQRAEPDKIIVRTYERGVENETRSCGTGVTAAALVCFHNDNGFNEVEVKTPGGKLSVDFTRINDRFENIWLRGPAEKVFEGVAQL